MDIERPTRKPSRVWKAFAQRWRGHRFLKHEALHALPEKFVLYLNCEARDLIGYDDLNFEYDLLRTAHHGFFLKQPIGARLHTEPKTNRIVETTNEEIDFEPERATAKRQLMLPREPAPWVWESSDKFQAHRYAESRVRELVAKGLNEHEAKDLIDDDWKVRTKLDRQMEEYSGWLIQQAEFWSDLREAKGQCEAQVVARGGMPVLNPDSGTHSPDGLEYDDYYTPDGPEKEVYWVRRVCRKWCLAGLDTWELFSPLKPQLVADGGHPLGIGQGLTLNLPYTSLAGSQLDVRELVRRLRAEYTPQHLRGWVRITDAVAAGSTKRNFHKEFMLYKLLALCLLRRYPNKIEGNTARLDQVLANYLADPKAAAKAGRSGVNVDQTHRRRFALMTKLKKAAGDALHWL